MLNKEDYFQKWGIRNKVLTCETTPFFIYNLSIVKENITKLKSLFKINDTTRVKILFSMKSNPNVEILKFLVNEIDGFDVSSKIELECLLSLNIAPNRISFSGPGKTDDTLDFALKNKVSVLHIDSIDEYLSVQKNKFFDKSTTKLSLRLPLEYTYTNKLGIPKEDIEALLLDENCEYKGLHAYLGRESFSWKYFNEVVEMMSDLKKNYSHAFDEDFIHYIGPGISNLDQKLDRGENNYKDIGEIHLEVGRCLLANAGVYAAPILSVKKTELNRRVVIIDGGLHHIGSPFLSLQKNDTNVECIAMRDGEILDDSNSQSVMVYGGLCLWHDCLHPKIELTSNLKRGDWLVFDQCGAYGITSAFPFFIGENMPDEYVYEEETESLRKVSPAGFTAYHDSFFIEESYE